MSTFVFRCKQQDLWQWLHMPFPCAQDHICQCVQQQVMFRCVQRMVSPHGPSQHAVFSSRIAIYNTFQRAVSHSYRCRHTLRQYLSSSRRRIILHKTTWRITPTIISITHLIIIIIIIIKMVIVSSNSLHTSPQIIISSRYVFLVIYIH